MPPLNRPIELHHTPWVSLYRIGSYVYSHETRSDGKIVAVLGYLRKHPQFVLGRFEATPCHGNKIELVSLTGGVERNSPLHSARKELYEEAGYNLLAEKFISLGTVRPSKSQDTVVFLYAVPINKGKPYMKCRGEGDEEDKKDDDFKDHYCQFVHWTDAIASSDPLLVTLTVRLAMHLDFENEMGLVR